MPRIIDDWDEDDVMPPGYVRRERYNKGLLISGSVVLGSLWTITIIGASSGISDGDDSVISDSNTAEDHIPLFIPAIGPFISLATLDTEGLITSLIVGSGIGQAAGLGLLIAGLVAKDTVLVRTYDHGYVGFSLSVTPQLSPTQSGLGFTGSF